VANRVLLGNHGTYGYGLYVSKSTIDVTGANIEDFLFASTATNNNQLLLLEWIPITHGGSGTTTVTQQYANFNKDCEVMMVYTSGGEPVTAGSATDAWSANDFGSLFTGLVTLTNTKTSSSVGTLTLTATGASSYTLNPIIAVFTQEI